AITMATNTKLDQTIDISLKNIVPLDARFHFEQMTSRHIDQVVKMFTQAFCRSEPMTHYLAMDETLYTTFARAVTEKAVADGLSVVIMEGDKVVASAIVEDLMDP